MESKTNEKKNMSEKAECEFCGKLGAISNKTQHQKTISCLKAQKTGKKYEPRKPDDVLQTYREQNTAKRDKALATLGAEVLREKQKLAKQAQRAKNKPKVEEEKKILPSENKIQNCIDLLESTGLKVVNIKTKKNKQNCSAPPKVQKETEQKTVKSVKTKQEFIDQFITDSGLTEKTAKQYVNNFYSVGKKYTKKDIDLQSLDWLKDYQSVYKYINTSIKPNGVHYENSSKKVHLESLSAISKYLGKDFSTASEKYILLATNYNKNQEKKSKDNKLSEKQKSKYIPYEELQKLESSLNKSNSDTLVRTIFGLYTLLPARRAEDYRMMKIKIKKNKKNTTKDIDLPEGYNYLMCSINGLPTRMVFKSYKTFWKYKTYIISNIPPRLANILQEYIKDEKLNTDDYLIPTVNDKRKAMDQGNFSNLISDTLQQVTKKHIDINSIRISYATYITKNKDLSENELEKIALSMGTSVDKLRTSYRKIS